MPVDYIGEYFNEQGFDFTRLLNDDFFQPVRILFNAKHYVSASKLLVVAIDSISFVEYGNIQENTFTKWLNAYSDIDSLDITAIELWEHRNALLHMSSLNSRKVASGKVRSLVSYVGELPSEVKLDTDKTGYYSLHDLIQVFGQACGKWCLTYDKDRSKIDSFVERYDLIASDARMMHVDVSEIKNANN